MRLIELLKWKIFEISEILFGSFLSYFHMIEMNQTKVWKFDDYQRYVDYKIALSFANWIYFKFYFNDIDYGIDFYSL